MTDNNKTKIDELISRVFNEDPLLRSYLRLAKPQTEALTEEQKKENLVKAIMDAGKPKQTK